jgi:hypothetical protein
MSKLELHGPVHSTQNECWVLRERKNGQNWGHLIKRLTFTMWLACLVTAPLLAQSPRKIAEINKKVVGKWWSGDKKQYIEFLPNRVCFEGALFPDGKWHIEKGKLSAGAQGDSFMCNSGVLTLVGPNKLTRDYGMGGAPQKYYRGLQNIPRRPDHLSVAVAQLILDQQINSRTMNNTLFTCHACSDPTDKQDNDKAPLVSSYPGALIPYLISLGYIRRSDDRQFFTAKAKRSKYYALREDFAGLRFANSKNPRILVRVIADPRHVPVEYEFVPTPLTARVLGRARMIKAFASFSYENEVWSVCIGCK